MSNIVTPDSWQSGIEVVNIILKKTEKKKNKKQIIVTKVYGCYYVYITELEL